MHNDRKSKCFSRFWTLTVFLLLIPTISLPQQRPPDAAVEQRIDALLRQMTLEEKIGQLSQFTAITPATLAMVRQGKVGSLFNISPADTRAAQQIAVEQSRLKIPLLIGNDVIHGYRTIFPVPIATASSFDPPLIEDAERIAAREASAAGVKWTFAPMVDIARDPRWGRIVEGAGEDPNLGSVVAAARVRGFQGRNIADADAVVACAKHFAGYGAVEGGREYDSANIPGRLLREVYLPPFHAAVNAGAGSIMSAFTALDGVPGVANRHLLTGVLRNDWGFGGVVVSDYSAVHELIAHGVAADDAQAAIKALTAGVDVDMQDAAYDALLSVRRNQLPLQAIDQAVRRVLRLKFEAGLFDHPYADPARESKEIFTAENVAAARKVAQESMVLLKNEADVLPLPATVKTIAVIGPLADDTANQLGPHASAGRASDAVSPLAGIRAAMPHARVLHAKGANIPSFERPQAAPEAIPGAPAAMGVAGSTAERGPASFSDAMAAARQADVVILFLGELAEMTGEASSRASLNLPGEQEQLLEAVAATGKPVVLVLESGRPLDIRWANEHVAAILQAWYPGVQAGNAIADVLFGQVSPSARLPITWARSVGQIPVYYNHLSTGRPTSPDRWHTGYLDESSSPLFPFGFGLTYGKFEYSNLRIETPKVSTASELRVAIEVRNAGAREAAEVVQLYVHGRVAPTARPVRELKGFRRVSLRPGQKETVAFTVKATDLGSYDLDMHWVVPPGTYDVWVAPNAAEGVHGTFEVQ